MGSADNPMNRALRCHAHSKRSGLPCKAPAVKGWKVCRMHGARGGGPRGKRNGNYRSGAYTYETLEAATFLRTMARLVRKMDIP